MNPVLRLRPPLILASQSPRRRALLERINVSFQVQVSPADETMTEPAPPRETAQTLALRKARPVAAEAPSSLVLAADTLVAHGDAILGKPETSDHARRMLRRLSDTTHEVYTGVALCQEEHEREVSTVTVTRVTFATLSDDEIDSYVATGAPMDKAGSYGIQDHTGPLFVESIEGDYYNVVGLPLRTLYRTLQEEFSSLLARSQ